MKHTQEIYVHLAKYEEGKYMINQFDMSDCGYVLVNKQEVEFEVPDDFDPVPVKIAMLKAQEAKVREEFDERINQIKDQISNLQAISYEVPA